MKNNDNDLVISCIEYVYNNVNSICENKIGISEKTTAYNIHDFSNLNKAIRRLNMYQASVLSGEEQSLIADRVHSSKI